MWPLFSFFVELDSGTQWLCIHPIVFATTIFLLMESRVSKKHHFADKQSVFTYYKVISNYFTYYKVLLSILLKAMVFFQ